MRISNLRGGLRRDQNLKATSVAPGIGQGCSEPRSIVRRNSSSEPAFAAEGGGCCEGNGSWEVVSAQSVPRRVGPSVTVRYEVPAPPTSNARAPLRFSAAALHVALCRFFDEGRAGKMRAGVATLRLVATATTALTSLAFARGRRGLNRGGGLCWLEVAVSANVLRCTQSRAEDRGKIRWGRIRAFKVLQPSRFASRSASLCVVSFAPAVAAEPSGAAA